MGLATAALTTGAARADGPASWQFTPVAGPPPPIGISPAPFAVPLGAVGQLSFWAPNRGLLITGGTEDDTQRSHVGGVVPAGLYAYDGVSWHLLSTVCGGGDGRIAWAGPDEFWTISDQRPGPYLGTVAPDYTNLSLCHFLDGQVVASYAMPIGQLGAYEPMNAAACTNTDDCWFGGTDTVGATPGAFQLHWDGANLSALQAPEDHAVDDMTEYQGQIVESVELQPSDSYLSSENPAHPAVLHRIGSGEAGPFTDVYAYSQSQGVLPIDGSGMSPDELSGFSLSTDGGSQGAGATQLWGAANPSDSSSPATLTILHNDQSGWSQLPVSGSSPTSDCETLGESVDPETDALELDGAGGVPLGDNDEDGTSTGAIAAMPGTDTAWLSLDHYVGGNPAVNPYGTGPEVAQIDDQGCVQQLINGDVGNPDQDTQFNQQPDQSSTPGASGPITCPATNDCWMATSNGWLYHYTDGTQYPQDTDPNFAGVITVRPDDAATVVTFSDVPPVDDSGDNPPAPVAPTGAAKTSGRRTQLLTHVKVKVEHRTTLVMTFELTARARIQLVALRHKTAVARTHSRIFSSGKHTLKLKLNPERYPTHIKVNAKLAGTST